MSRRSGQVGRIEKKGQAFYARFWLDVPGQQTRTYKSVKICPVSGPGSLNKFEQKRRLQEILAESGCNSEATLREAEAVNLGTTFQEQAKRWLEDVQKRKRKPIKPRTASSWASCLKWINAEIGEMPLCSVNNLAVKELIAKMATEKQLSPKTINNHVQVVKMVVASAINEKGEEIYPMKWNHVFMDLPEVTGQRTPVFSAEEITAIVARAEGQFSLLYALLSGSGLRIGEALALQLPEDVQGTVIRVRHTLWNGALGSPKTVNGLREVDLHPSLAEALQAHIAGRTSGFVFLNEAGGPLHQSNVLRRSLHKILEEMKREKCGFHSFRRFRVTHLRKQRVPEDLIRFWIGHADKSITDGYSKVKEDVEFRRFTAEQAGLGFHMPPVAAKLPVAPIAPKSEVGFFSVSA